MLKDIVNNSLKHLGKNSTLDEIKECINTEIFSADYEITHDDYIYIFDNIIYSLERL